MKWTLVVVLLAGYSVISVRKSWNDDFRAYYQAGTHLLSGDDIYDQDIVEGRYLYSPFFALLMVPLSLIPQKAAATFWYFGNLGSLLFILGMAFYLIRNPAEGFLDWLRGVLKAEPADKTIKAGALIVLILGARFWLNSIEHGQVNLQVWAAALGGVYYLKRDRAIRGGALVAAAVLTKLLPGLLLFYFLLKRRYRFVLASILWMLAMTVLPAAFVGWGHNLDLFTGWYQAAIGPGLTPGGIAFGDGNQSFPSMLARFLSPTPANEGTGATVNFLDLAPGAVGAVTLIASFCFLTVIAVLALTKWGDPVERENVGLSVVMLSAALMPALAWKAYFVVSLMGYAVIVHAAVGKRLGQYRLLVLSLTVFSFVLHTLTSDGIWGWDIAHVFHSYSCITFSMLSLYAALVVMLLRPRTEEIRPA